MFEYLKMKLIADSFIFLIIVGVLAVSVLIMFAKSYIEKLKEGRAEKYNLFRFRLIVIRLKMKYTYNITQDMEKYNRLYLQRNRLKRLSEDNIK